MQHALAIPDAELAARLIEAVSTNTLSQGQIFTVLGWINAMPEEQVQTRPFLCVMHAALLTLINQFEEAEARLQLAERGLHGLPDEQAQFITGYVLTIRSGIASFSGNIAEAVTLARQALQILTEAQVSPRASALATAARSHHVSGDVTIESEREVKRAVAVARSSDDPFARVSSMCLLARLYALQGRLRRAVATHEQVLQVIQRPELLPIIYRSLYYFGQGDLLCEYNDLEAAEQLLLQGMALVKETLTVEAFASIRGYSALARLQQARGNTTAALATLDAWAQLAEQRHFAPHLLTRGAAIRAQVELAQGNLAAAMRWVESSGLSTEDEDLPYLREGQYLALARVRIEQARRDPLAPSLQDVLRLLDRLLQDAEAKARLNSVLEILVLQALTLEVQGNRTDALAKLERALVLAEPEGYIRLFVDEGQPMLALLRLAHARSRVPGYVATLLRAFGEQPTSEAPSSSALPGVLVEPLTGREREGLGLLLAGASNREIARRLVVSVNTVKRHVFNLCTKLGVQSRAQAIVRTRDLNLL